MEVEKFGRMEPFNDLKLGKLFYRDRLGMRVSFASDRNVLWFDAEPKAVVFEGADLVNKSVFVLDNPVFQVTCDLALWRLGIPNGPASGMVIVSKNGQWLRAYHSSGEFDIDLVSGEGHRIKADENVAWTRAWRIVVKTGTENEAPLLQSVHETSNRAGAARRQRIAEARGFGGDAAGSRRRSCVGRFEQELILSPR